MTTSLKQELASLLPDLLDGSLSETQRARLNDLVQSSDEAAVVVVDHLLMDSLLEGELGAESLAAVVDMLGDTGTDSASAPRQDARHSRSAGSTADQAHNHRAAAASRAASPPKQGRLARTIGWLISVAAAAVLLVVASQRGGSEVFADASDVIMAAAAAHDSAVERVYAVTTRKQTLWGDFQPPKDVRVYTQGNEFWVQMDERPQWSWGRQKDGAIWLALGTTRAMRIAPAEIGAPLHDIAELYSVNWESLLLTLLDGFDLQKSETESTYEIRAEPNRRNRRWIRRLDIVVDRETKAVRKMVLHRRVSVLGESTMTFELLEARTADVSQYRLEGHLTSDAVVYTQASRRDPRRQTLVNHFGQHARRWIIEPSEETTADDGTALTAPAAEPGNK